MFAHAQSITSNGQVSSVQSLALNGMPVTCDEATAWAAGRLYFDFVARFGSPFLRVNRNPSGSVQIRAAGILLLSFGVPSVIVSAGQAAIRYPVGQGLVVQSGREGQGYLQMAVSPEHVSLAVEGYYASIPGPRAGRLRVWLYQYTQSAVHVRIARGYLPRLAELALK